MVTVDYYRLSLMVRYIIGGVLVVSWVLIMYEIWSAPEMDERTGRVIRPQKKLKDLFK